MELTQLRYFLESASRRSFTAAAERLGVTQSALSRSVAKLEEELGQPVFERQGRGLALTDAGRLLQPRAKRILTLVADVKGEITDDGRTGVVRVAAIPTVAPYLLPAVLSRFAETFPESRTVVQEDVTDNVLRQVHQGEVDLAVVALPIPERHLAVEPLFEEELLVVMPAGHPLAGKPDLTLADIETLPFVLLEEAHCLTDAVVTFCRQRNVQPVAVERTSQLTTVQELVALGHGISMIPAMARVLDIDLRRVYRSLTGTRPVRRLAVVWNPYRFQSRLVQRFRGFLTASADAPRTTPERT